MRLFFIIISIMYSINLTAGEWSKKIYLDSYDYVWVESTVSSYDYEDNLWFATNKGFWVVADGKDTAEYIPFLARNNDTLWYNQYANDPTNKKAYILWHEETALGHCNDTIFYLTSNELVRFDNTYPFFSQFNILKLNIQSAFYYDSSYICLIADGLHKYLGFFKYSEQTKEWTRLCKFDSTYTVPNLAMYAFPFYKWNDFYIYANYNSGITFFNESKRYGVNLLELTEDTSLMSVSYYFKDSILHYTTPSNLWYKINLNTFNYEVEDLRATPMYKNHIDANPNLYISIWEINDDFMMTNNLYQKLDSSIYIKYKGGDWRVIDRSFLGKYSVDGPEYPVFSPDKDKVWFYFFYTVIPDTVINGREMYKFLISYNIYKDTTSVAEETEGFPTVLPTKLYPNPAKRMVTVNFFLNPNYREKVKFEIYDYMGCKIKELDGSYSYNASEAFGSKQIDVEDISTGIYYLVIDNGSEKRSIGFAVE